MPSVLPRKRTSSTSSLSLSPWMCGAMSSAVSSLRLFPSSEKILESDMVSCEYPACKRVVARVAQERAERIEVCM